MTRPIPVEPGRRWAHTPTVMRDRSGHVLATVVFTDIVDSSTLAGELGDARWRVLLSRHHAIVRKALKRYHGKEIDNAGDGFFATFPDQADAIRCACAISDDVRELGIEVRAGCHVGQAELIEHKLGGITIHAAARVMSQAGPGEVLVSATLKDLVPASGFGFTDRGERSLKGIEGSWHLYAVATVDGKERLPPLEADEAAHRRASIQPPTLAERRSGRIGIGAAVLAVIAGASFIYLHRAKPPEPIQILPSSVLRIDPTTATVIADIPVAEPGAGQIVDVQPEDEIWVLSHPQQVGSVIDASTNEVSGGPVPVGRGQAGSTTSGFGMVFDFGRVWVAPVDQPRTIERIDPVERNADPKLFNTPGSVGRLASGYGELWVPVWEDDGWHIVAMDPETGHPRCNGYTPGGIPVLLGSVGNVAAGEDAVWTTDQVDFTVWRIDRQRVNQRRSVSRVSVERLPGSASGSGSCGFPTADRASSTRSIPRRTGWSSGSLFRTSGRATRATSWLPTEACGSQVRSATRSSASIPSRTMCRARSTCRTRHKTSFRLTAVYG